MKIFLGGLLAGILFFQEGHAQPLQKIEPVSFADVNITDTF